MAVKKQLSSCDLIGLKTIQEVFIMWTTPEYTEMRFGFEVTMYIANR